MFQVLNKVSVETKQCHLVTVDTKNLPLTVFDRKKVSVCHD